MATNETLNARLPVPPGPVVHVSVEHFLEAVPRRKLDDLMSLTDRFDRALGRYGDGWLRPSADEAVRMGDASWGVDEAALDWAVALTNDVRNEVGLDCSVGIAATWVAARICSRIARPRGVLLWLSGYEEGLVTGLPIEDLDELRPDQLARLRTKGVRTIGDMVCLAPDEARASLGSEASKLVGLVRGLDRASDPSSGSRLDHTVKLLSRRLAQRLVQCGREARGLELRVSFDGGGVRDRYTLLPRATASEDALHGAAGRLLSMAPRRERPVVGLSLTATGLTPLKGSGEWSQLDLFRRATRPRELTVTIGRADGG